MKKIIKLSIILGAISPILAFAATDLIGPIIIQLIGYLSFFLPAIITVAIIYFVWGVVQYMMASDEEQKKLGRSKIINGLIGLFVIVSFWGLIEIVKTSFGITNTPTASRPCTHLDSGKTVGGIACP